MKRVITHPLSHMHLVRENRITILGLTINPTRELLQKKIMAKKTMIIVNTNDLKPLQLLYDEVLRQVRNVELVYTPGNASEHLQGTALSKDICGQGIFLILKNKEVFVWDCQDVEVRVILSLIKDPSAVTVKKPAA